MRFNIEVDMERQVLMLCNRSTLDEVFETYEECKESPEMAILGMRTTMRKLGLLDDDDRPTWR